MHTNHLSNPRVILHIITKRNTFVVLITLHKMFKNCVNIIRSNWHYQESSHDNTIKGSEHDYEARRLHRSTM